MEARSMIFVILKDDTDFATKATRFMTIKININKL